MLPLLEVNPDISDFHVLHATAWANSPICWKSQPFRSLCIRALLILGLFGINRAWLHKDLKGWDFQQIGISSGNSMQDMKVRGAWVHFPVGDNILLLDFF